ncbi:MAG: FAD-dependent oxidoreductase, partial [Candidatus Bipolaricaulota bacterium]|nr:FAD-dependent oxidoreductase [Candidatus Bipolaricaulota bacterium]
PIVVATLNAPSSAVSYRAARHVFREAFFIPHGADMGLFTIPLGDVFDAARRYLEARDSRAEVDAHVERVLARDGRVRGVRLADGREVTGDAVIVAVPPDALAGLVSGIPELAPIVGLAQRLEWAPIVNVHLTFDRKVLDDAFAVGIDSAVQAVFDRDPTTDHQTLILSQSVAAQWIDRPDSEIIAELSSALRALLPAVRGANLIDSLVLRHQRATFVSAPGSDALRPKSRTPIPGLYLAGDWTATGWPSTIESAVRSGIYAAAAVEIDTEKAAEESVRRTASRAPEAP